MSGHVLGHHHLCDRPSRVRHERWGGLEGVGEVVGGYVKRLTRFMILKAPSYGEMRYCDISTIKDSYGLDRFEEESNRPLGAQLHDYGDRHFFSCIVPYGLGLLVLLQGCYLITVNNRKPPLKYIGSRCFTTFGGVSGCH